MKRLLLIFAAALPIHAATTIEISAKFADVPAGMEISESVAKLEKIKGVNVLSAPRVTTTPGQKAVVEVTQSQSTPGGASVPLGLTLEITPTLDEKSIAFTGSATDRAMHGKRTEGRVNVVEFATREVYFSGTTSSGATILIHTAAAVTKGAEVKARELVILLTLSKKTTEPEAPKRSTEKKPVKATPAKAPAGKKSATTKITPAKKK